MKREGIYAKVDAIALALQTPADAQGTIGVPVLLIGDPGRAKTAVTRTLGQELGAHVETVLLSLRDPTEVGGWPRVTGEPESLSYVPPGYYRRIVEALRGGAPFGILFLDELTTAAPSVQATALRVVHERVVGDYALPQNCAVMAACNPPETAAGGFELAAPLANRFAHFPEWGGLDALDWAAQNIAGRFSLGEGVPRLALGDWRKAYPEARRTISGFIHRFPHLLNAMPEQAALRSGAWPSSRTWEMGQRLLAACMAVNREDLSVFALAACVGDGTAHEFAAWKRYSDLPDPEEILRKPESWKPDLERGDVTFTTLLGVAVAACRKDVSDKDLKARWQAAWTVVAMAAEAKVPDVAAHAARHLLLNRPSESLGIPSEIRALLPILRQAGLVQG